MKYKVLHVFSSYSMGGAEKSMLFLASSLDKSQRCENIVAVPGYSKLFKESVQKNLKTITFKAINSFDLLGILKLIKIIKKYSINIVHVHQGKLYWTSLVAKLFCRNTKVIFHRRQDTRHGIISRIHYRFTDAVIAVSKSVADGLIKYEKVSPDKIKVVYNGVDFDKFSDNVYFDDIIREYNLQDKTVVGTVGAIVDFKGKGQIYLVEAAKFLRKDYPNLRYLIVGSGKGFEEQKAYAENLKIEDIVYFVGYQEQVQKFISAMDIFCLLSWDTEGMPNVVIEAQALKKPVIVTSIGGNPESFIAGTTGIMIEPSNYVQVAQAIKKLVDNPDTTKQIGNAGKQFVEKNFSIEKMVKSILAIYKQVMK
ncbi:glycosyl transferase group 1 [Endomicrobiia bacterium]|nr:glycosyl transferase group 1 [Endomicrobiia bacterium]GHT65103.1 glycosyl transferase group 1 [Endomicrobiia bacterium]GHT70187.1 glycosyl transferase group 1 [Endomicrobiia bacterium]GHT74464.1 glycosyl transferase group 1 [Endomicrobiia bacterium]